MVDNSKHIFQIYFAAQPRRHVRNYLIQEDRVDVLILLSPVEEERFVSELKKRNIPYVLIDNQLSENNASAITVELMLILKINDIS